MYSLIYTKCFGIYQFTRVKISEKSQSSICSSMESKAQLEWDLITIDRNKSSVYIERLFLAMMSNILVVYCIHVHVIGFNV